MPNAARIVLVTVPRGAAGERLARRIVAEKLAACVNVVPKIAAHYRWNGRAVRGAEQLLIIKTVTTKVGGLKRWIAAHHPYDVPEFLVLAVAQGSRAYLSWLAESVR